MRPWALSKAEDILGRTIQAIILKVSYQSCSRGHCSHFLRAGGHGRNCSRQAREPSVKRGKKQPFLWERHTSGRWRVDVSKVVPQPEPKNKEVTHANWGQSSPMSLGLFSLGRPIHRDIFQDQ